MLSLAAATCSGASRRAGMASAGGGRQGRGMGHAGGILCNAAVPFPPGAAGWRARAACIAAAARIPVLNTATVSTQERSPAAAASAACRGLAQAACSSSASASAHAAHARWCAGRGSMRPRCWGGGRFSRVAKWPNKASRGARACSEQCMGLVVVVGQEHERARVQGEEAGGFQEESAATVPPAPHETRGCPIAASQPVGSAAQVAAVSP